MSVSSNKSNEANESSHEDQDGNEQKEKLVYRKPAIRKYAQFDQIVAYGVQDDEDA